MNTIHVTERSTFKQCRRQWKYQYRENLLKPQDSMNALWIGRGVHAALAQYYSGQDPIEALDEWLDAKLSERTVPLTLEDQTKLDEYIQLMQGMLEGYVEFARKNDDFEVLALEQPIAAKIPGTRGQLCGTIDMLVRQRGKLWVYDHKTFTSFAEPDQLELDDQMTAYLWLVWKAYGEKPAGAVYNQLRKKVPAEPMLLKAGDRLSKDKSIDTTQDIYRRAILRHGFNPADYEDILDKLSQNEFFRREIIPRNSWELNSFENFLSAEYRDLTSKNTILYPNATKDCTFCDYRILCKSENEDGDTLSLKRNLYVVETERRL